MTRKVVLITGGASGIGYAAALLSAQRDWLPILADRDAEALATASADLAGMGHECASVEFDVTDREQCVGRIAEMGERHGAISALVTCAGITLPGWGRKTPVPVSTRRSRSTSPASSTPLRPRSSN